MLLELTVFLPYLSDMFPQREELIIIPMNTACIKKKEKKTEKNQVPVRLQPKVVRHSMHILLYTVLKLSVVFGFGWATKMWMFSVFSKWTLISLFEWYSVFHSDSK